jgi:hypothetical protein
MSHQVDLGAAWTSIIPVRKGTHGDLVFEHCADQRQDSTSITAETGTDRLFGHDSPSTYAVQATVNASCLLVTHFSTITN